MELIQRAYETDVTVFPGAHPVSIERKHLPLLRNDYVVCEKTDGTRYLSLIHISEPTRPY